MKKKTPRHQNSKGSELWDDGYATGAVEAFAWCAAHIREFYGNDAAVIEEEGRRRYGDRFKVNTERNER